MNPALTERLTLLLDALPAGVVVLDGSGCVLRVTMPREPCGKFTAVMGLADAAQRMVREARSGFYLAVEVPGDLRAGSALRLMPGPRRLSVAEAIRGKWARHRNG